MLFKSTICFFFFTEGLLALALVSDHWRDDLTAAAFSSNSFISVSQLKDLKAKNSEVIAQLQLIQTILDSYISKKENILETLDENINLEELIKENINAILEGNINLQELLGINFQDQDNDFRNELKQPWESLATLWNEFSGKLCSILTPFVHQPFRPVISDFINPRPIRFPDPREPLPRPDDFPIPTDI